MTTQPVGEPHPLDSTTRAKLFSDFIQELDKKLQSIYVGGVIVLDNPLVNIQYLESQITDFERKLFGTELIIEWELNKSIVGEDYSIEDTKDYIQHQIEILNRRLKKALNSLSTGTYEFNLRVVIPQKNYPPLINAMEWGVEGEHL